MITKWVNYISDEVFVQLDARYRVHAIQILRQLDELTNEEKAPAEDSRHAVKE